MIQVCAFLRIKLQIPDENLQAGFGIGLRGKALILLGKRSVKPGLDARGDWGLVLSDT